MDEQPPGSPPGTPPRPDTNEEGVDITLIRWSLSLSPLERLRVLESFMDFATKAQAARHHATD